jgi:hypothetical protein
MRAARINRIAPVKSIIRPAEQKENISFSEGLARAPVIRVKTRGGGETATVATS